MADIHVRVGSPTEVVQDDRRADVAQFVEELQAHGKNADLEVVEYVPGRRGLGLVEAISISIGSGVSGALINDVTSDIYELAKSWARRRLRKKSEEGSRRPIGFTIYGPDGKVLRQWDTREDQRDEGDPSGGDAN